MSFFDTFILNKNEKYTLSSKYDTLHLNIKNLIMKIIESSDGLDDISNYRYSLILGISINNSYFNCENLEKLISWAVIQSNHVYIMIPDEPAIHTLMAIGYQRKEAENKSRLKSNALTNKCTRIIENLSQKDVIHIIRWKDLVNNNHYKKAYYLIEKAYEYDYAFRYDIRETTRAVLDSSVQNSTKENIDTGVIFLLKELAFILYSNLILNEEKTLYMYHKTMGILKNILRGEYQHLEINTNVGFVTVE